MHSILIVKMVILRFKTTLNAILQKMVQIPLILTIPTNIPVAKETWLSVAKAPLRSVGETSWM